MDQLIQLDILWIPIIDNKLKKITLSKLETSYSFFNVGMKGGITSFLSIAPQFTIENHGCVFIYSAPL